MSTEPLGPVSGDQILDDVPEDVKSDRVTRLVAIQRDISIERNRRFVGRTLPVLIETTSKKDPNKWRGRIDHNVLCVFADPTRSVGDIAEVVVEDTTANTLFGRRA